MVLAVTSPGSDRVDSAPGAKSGDARESAATEEDES
jgi:hypothetical protein